MVKGFSVSGAGFGSRVWGLTLYRFEGFGFKSMVGFRAQFGFQGLTNSWRALRRRLGCSDVGGSGEGPKCFSEGVEG